MALKPAKLATIHSYIDQLRHSDDTTLRSSAALALGKLDRFIPKETNAPQVAVELGIFDALLEVLMDPNDHPDVHEACLVGLSQLVAPAPGPDADRAWPHLRKAVSTHLMSAEVLGELAFQATSSTRSRALMGLGRLVCGLSRFTNTSNEALVLHSGLLGALVGAVGHAPVPRDSAVAALAALQLASCSPGLFKAAVRKPARRREPRGRDGQREGDTAEGMTAAEMGAEFEEEGEGPGEPVTLFTELVKLYASSITPGYLGPEALPWPSDAASLLLSALTLSPKGMSGSQPRKVLLRRCLEAGAPACLVSYVVVECGALTSSLATLAESVAAVLEQSGAAAEQSAREVRERMAVVKADVDGMRQELAELAELGREEEQQSLAVAAAKDELKAEYRALRRVVASLDSQSAVTEHAATALREWVGRNARPSGKVRRTAPSVPVLRQVVGALGALGSAPTRGADMDPDLVAEALSEACGAAMLASGLVPAALRLARTADAAGVVVAELGGIMTGLKVPEQLGDLLGGALRVLSADAARVAKLNSQVEARLKALRGEAERVRKALTYGTAQGTARAFTPLSEHNTLSPGIRPSDLEERAGELADEEHALMSAQANMGMLTDELAAHITRVSAVEQELLAAADRAARALPPPPSASSPTASPSHSRQGPLSSPSGALASPSAGGPAAHTSSSSPSALLDPSHPAGSLIPLLAGRLKRLARPRNNMASLLAVIQGGEQAGSAAGAGGAGLSPSSSFASLSLASPRTSSPTAARGRPASAKPTGDRSLPAPLAGSKPKNKLGLESNYTNVIFTQSPMRGHPPKGTSSAPKPPQLNSPQGYDEGALGPELQVVALLDEIEEVVGNIRECVLLMPTDDVSRAAARQGEGEGEYGEDVRGLAVVMEEDEEGSEVDSAEGRPTLVVDSMVKQAVELTQVLSSLASLTSAAAGLSRSARMLPAGSGLKYSRMAPEQLLANAADLMRSFAVALQQPADCQQVAAAVAEVASQGLTEGRRDYEVVYIKSGVVEGLVDLLDGRRRQQAAQEGDAGRGAEEGGSTGGSTAPSPRSRSASPRKARKTGGAPALSKGRTQSRYDLAPPVMRPSAVTVAEQAAAAKALAAIGARHPEALVAVSEDAGALASMCDLCNDHSLDPLCRLSAATLLAKMLIAGAAGGGDGRSSEAGSTAGGPTQGLAQAALSRGAFTALMGIMDSDHRQGSGGAKDAVVTALAAIAADDTLCEAVVSAVESGPGSSGQHSSPSGGMSLRSGSDVCRAVLRVLWGVPLQLYQLMSSDRTKKGKTVDPQVVKPLSELATVACQQLSGLAVGDRAAKSMLKGMGVGSKINITFLQAIKNPDLHGALLELRATVS